MSMFCMLFVHASRHTFRHHSVIKPCVTDPMLELVRGDDWMSHLIRSISIDLCSNISMNSNKTRVLLTWYKMTTHAGTLNTNYRLIRVPDHWKNIPIPAACSAADRDPKKNDTSTGGTTFSNLYKIDQWSMLFPKLEARCVNSYGELRKLTFSEGPLK